MQAETVRELMIPLRDYAVVPESATLAEVTGALREATTRLGPGRQPPRAVLAVNADGQVAGQLGYLEFLKALEPKFQVLGDLDMLSRAGVRSDLIDAIADDLHMWQGTIADACRRARDVYIRDIMRPITESIDESATLSHAIHKFIIWQTPRILVTRQSEVVGVLRLADLWGTLIDYIDDAGK